ncbi:MAG: hypothetical protein LBT51_10535 [Fusobacteriaceae bacterium]|jgi:hypothetical protein|nr:hypothetical protein [Fusobacteriaceae bacterium]
MSSLKNEALKKAIEALIEDKEMAKKASKILYNEFYQDKYNIGFYVRVQRGREKFTLYVSDLEVYFTVTGVDSLLKI